MKNNNLTQLDTDQIHKRKFDDNLDADRVVLVGGDNIRITVDTDQITNSIKDGLKNIKIDQKESNIQIIEKNVFIPQIEIREIEKQVIVKEIEYRTIEVIKYIEVPKIIEYEKPIVVQEIKTIEVLKDRDYPFILKFAAILQAVSIVALLIINLLKK